MHISERRRAITHCPHGHQYNEANTYLSKSNRRHCRACAAERTLTRQREHPERSVAATLRWRANHPERASAADWRQMLRKYGLTPKSYGVLLGKQEGLCAICANQCKSGRNLAIDHNHKTLKVRGLLCMNCNNGLGRFGDDVLLLEKAGSYLKTFTLT